MGLEVRLEEAERIRGPKLWGKTIPCPRGGELEGFSFKLVPGDRNIKEVR